jgi:hypothetical protein
VNELQSEASQALLAVLSGFDFINNLKTLAPTTRAMLNHERWQMRLVELLLSCSPPLGRHSSFVALA